MSTDLTVAVHHGQSMGSDLTVSAQKNKISRFLRTPTVEVPHRVIIRRNNITDSATRTVQPEFSDLHNTLGCAGNSILRECRQRLLISATPAYVCKRWQVTDSATQVLGLAHTVLCAGNSISTKHENLTPTYLTGSGRSAKVS